MRSFLGTQIKRRLNGISPWWQQHPKIDSPQTRAQTAVMWWNWLYRLNPWNKESWKGQHDALRVGVTPTKKCTSNFEQVWVKLWTLNFDSFWRPDWSCQNPLVYPRNPTVTHVLHIVSPRNLLWMPLRATNGKVLATGHWTSLADIQTTSPQEELGDSENFLGDWSHSDPKLMQPLKSSRQPLQQMGYLLILSTISVNNSRARL